jgi:tetratricopeptide (TPR) repeat protein
MNAAKLGRIGIAVLFSGVFVPSLFAQTPSQTIIHTEDPEEAASRATVAKAQAAMDKKDFAGAAAICSDFLDEHPDDAAVHFVLGYADTALGKTDDAADEFRSATEIDPKMAAAFLNLGLTLLKDHPDEAIEPLRRAVELIPDQAEPKLLLGRALEATGDLGGAAEQFQGAESPGHPNFRIRVELGGLLLREKKAADAEREFRSALELKPNAGEAELGLADSLIAENKLEEAVAMLGTYLQAKPKDADVHAERASILGDLGKNDEALAELDLAAAIRPEAPAALKLRATIDFRLKKYDDALAALQKVEPTAPDDPDIHARIGHLLLGKKDYPGSVKELAIAFRGDPSQTEVLRDLVAAQYLGGNYAGALELIEALGKRETLSNGSWFIRATCYDKLGQKQNAIDAYQKFLQLNAEQSNDQYFVAAERVRILERELKEKKH